MDTLTAWKVRKKAKTLYKVLAPPPRETISEWTDKYRYTDDGKYYVATAAYQRGVMDALSDPMVEEVIMMTSVQIGKTEIILNTLGRYAHRDPCPIMWIFPKLEMAKDISKARLDPMFEVSPALQGLLSDKRTRDAKNSLTFKKIPGGFILLSGANSPASLSSWPIRILLGDEIDRWGKLIKAEGDILMLARKRTTRYASNKKIFLVSTPTEKGESRIEPAYRETNQQQYWVPCPHCGGFQTLKFMNLKFEYDKEAIKGLIEGADEAEEFEWKRKAIAKHIQAWFVCEHCGSVIEHEDKHDMVQSGEWRAKFPKIVERQGFHIWQAYSPFVTWAETAAEFLYSTGYPDRMRVFTNTVLGELFVEKGQGLECEIIGWAADGENWSLDYRVLWGNTQLIDTYEQLEYVWELEWERQDGALLSVDALGIDVGYNPSEKGNTENVDSNVIYDWVESASKLHRVFAVKGSSTRVEGVVKWTRAGKRRLKLWLVDGEQIKDVVLKRLRIEPGNPGSAHFPLNYEKQFFMMLTAEEKKLKAGRRVWMKVRERNEAVDTRQYAYASMLILKPKWGHIKRRMVEREVQEEPSEEGGAAEKRQRLRVKKRLKMRRR